MKITIEVFAALKDHFEKEFILECDNRISVSALMARLEIISPLSKPVLLKCRVAVNENFVSPDFILQNEERVCIIPPSSGG